MTRKNKDAETNGQIGAMKKLMDKNKGLALSFAVALALSNVGCLPSTKPDANTLVLEKEPADEAEREWGEEETNAAGTGNTWFYPGYMYSPYHYIGPIGGRATWTTPSTTSSSKAIGGYSQSRGNFAAS